MPSLSTGAPFTTRRWSESEAREVLASLERSGQTTAAFAAEHGLDVQRLYDWRRRVAEADGITFRELLVRPSQRVAPDAPFEIMLGSGVVVRVPPAFDADVLGRLARGRAGSRVLSLPPSVRLYVATQPIDGRKGPDSLMALVRRSQVLLSLLVFEKRTPKTPPRQIDVAETCLRDWRNRVARKRAAKGRSYW